MTSPKALYILYSGHLFSAPDIKLAPFTVSLEGSSYPKSTAPRLQKMSVLLTWVFTVANAVLHLLNEPNHKYT